MHRIKKMTTIWMGVRNNMQPNKAIAAKWNCEQQCSQWAAASEGHCGQASQKWPWSLVGEFQRFAHYSLYCRHSSIASVYYAKTMKASTHSFSQGATLPTSSRNAASSRLHIAHAACSAQIVISNANNLGIPVICRCAILPLEMRHAARKGERERWWG